MSFGSLRVMVSGQLGWSPVAGLTLDVLDLFLVGMNVAITHGLGPGVAVDAVQTCIRTW